MNGRVLVELSEEQVAEWVAKHLANAPERDDAWYEQVEAIWMAGRIDLGENPAA